ncbi:hypothetical protein PF008_g17568 [Phytophthora fragariae]|uniref:Tc1-like transposase DDE domain-containing protein n=2 Tax=Phytophthora fragariae TaxID=53985 RepID=A0A6G0R984_9STRA|nr:hypothetical protein PF008_g17568 [Phytophthora fragariae]
MAPVRRQHSHQIRCLCVSKWKKHYSYSRISREVELARTSVRDIIAHFKSTGHCVIPPRQGRPRLTTAREDRRILRATEQNRCISAAVLAAAVSKDTGCPITPQVVRNRLNESGLNGRSARKKPYLSKKHRQQRLAYAKRLAHFEEEDWETVIFTDEASVELHGTTGRVSVWRRTHEAFHEKCVVPTFKSSRKSLMVWSSISADGVDTMHFCEKNVDGEYYRGLLQKEIPITRQLLGLPTPTNFVQDNAPAHRAKATKTFVKQIGLHDLRHPPQSPDLNPIENVWAIMKRELNRQPASSIEDLKVKLLDIWVNISDDVIRKFVLSMPARLDADIASKGAHTKY